MTLTLGFNAGSSDIVASTTAAPVMSIFIRTCMPSDGLSEMPPESYLRKPLVALPVYVLVLYGWHFSIFFDAAVRHPLVHALQHSSFIVIGVLVWWSVLEPKRRRLHGDLWKIGHILTARFLGMFLGMCFVLIRVPIYTSVYGSGERALGLSPIADQQLAGGMMVSLDIVLMVFALAFFFNRAGQQHDADEALAARGAAVTSR